MEFKFRCNKEYSGTFCKMCAPSYGSSQDGCFRCDDWLPNLLYSLKISWTVFVIIFEAHIALKKKVSAHKTLLKIFFFHSTYLIAIMGTKLDVSESLRQSFGMVFKKILF